MARSNKKKANGSGTIKRRGDGRWEGQFTYYDEYGHQKRSSVYAPTQNECRKKLAAKVAEVDTTGTYKEPSTMTYRQWFELWLETKSAGWKPNTKRNYKQKAEKHILSTLGDKKLSNITPVMCQKLINSTKGLSPKTVKNLHSILHSSLEGAVKAKEISYNPASGLELPKVSKPVLHPLMDENISRLLDAAEGSGYYDLIVVALFTGMRISELIGLKWEDVSFKDRLITVSHQLQRSEDTGEYQIVSTKNDKSRVVPISQSLVAVIKSIRSKQAENQLRAGELWEGEGYVFADELGHHYKQSTVQHHFKKIARSAGFDDTRFHDLRHSCAILALQTGADIKTVSTMLGHYSTAFTMDVYGDVSETMQEQARNTMELAFKTTVKK